MLAGFIYDGLYAGIPYQDPTPEMSAHFAREAHIAATIYDLGLSFIAFGIFILLIRRVFRSAMNRPLKWGAAALLLGIFLPAEPSMYRGGGEPVGTNPGGFLLISASYTAVAAIDTYQQNSKEPAYDSGHFNRETLIPLFQGLSVLWALLLICLILFFGRPRAGPFRIFAAIFILAGGINLIRHLYPGYPPLHNNGYLYYPGAYFLMLAFPTVAFALTLKPEKPSSPST